MDIKPTTAQAMLRLRLDSELEGDLPPAIDQAHAQAVKYLDGKLYETEPDLVAAQDVRGIVVTDDIIAAQLLLVDVLVGSNEMKERESKTAAAHNILRQHRNQGV